MKNDSTADKNQHIIDDEMTGECKLPKTRLSFGDKQFADVLEERYACKNIVDDNLSRLDEKLNSLLMMKLAENGSYIRFIKNPTEEMKMIAVENNGLNLQYIKNQMFSHCLAACQQDGLALDYVNPEMRTFKICEAAIKNSYGLAIKFVDPDATWYEELSYMAVKYTGSNILYIKNPSMRVIIEVVKDCPRSILDNLDTVLKSPTLMDTLVTVNPYVIKYLPLDKLDKEQANMLCKFAIRMNKRIIEHIPTEHLTETVCLEFLEEFEYGHQSMNHPALYYIQEENQTVMLCLKALSYDPENIEWVFDSVMNDEIIQSFIMNSTHKCWWELLECVFDHIVKTKNIKTKFMFMLKCFGFYRNKKNK